MTSIKKLVLLALAATAALAVGVGSAQGGATACSVITDSGSCLDGAVLAGETGYDSLTLDSYSATNTDCAAGRRRTRHVKAKYWQPLHLYTYWTYYQQIKYCWNSAHTKITYFRRARWTGATNFGWGFDGNSYTNCGPTDVEHCSGKVGGYAEGAVTQGHYHVLANGMFLSKYPWLTITAYADGTSTGGWHW